jgi:hypothetical protein
MKITVAKALFNSVSYAEYRKKITDLLHEKKSIGPVQSIDLTHYSELNEIRMKRLDKTITLTPSTVQILQSLQEEYIWLVISEGWCGDAAQLLPVYHKMAAETDKIDLKIVLRDENLEFMDFFLTKKARSIPILVIIKKETGGVLGHWGPRPQAATDLVLNYKKEFGVIDETLKTNLQLWYHNDKGISTQIELTNLMRELDKSTL